MNRIAILSDIHFGKFARSTDFAVPGETIQDNSTGDMPIEEGLNKLLIEKKPSHIFIAGDLTSVGEPEEFYYCEKKLLSIAEKCGVAVENIICSLGNHDVDWNISKIAEGKLENDIRNRRYEKIPDDVKKCIVDSYQRLAASVALQNLSTIIVPETSDRGPMPYSGVFEKEEFIVFALNTGAFCTNEQEYAHGKLSREQLEWFDNMVMKYKDDERKKIVLMHHHPFNYAYPVPAADISLLEEGAEFIEIAIKGGIGIVIHGHRHHPRVETFQNQMGSPITFICAGSLSVNAKHRSNGEIPNMVHFLDVDKNKDYYVLHNYQYTGAEGWKAVSNNKVTPVDAVMRVGKLFSEQTRVAVVTNMKTSKENLQSLEWNQLDESLQFMRYSELNEFLKTQLKETHSIIGQFPDRVMLIRREVN